MSPFKSIRWRLLLWYGVILVAVLAAFGITAYQLERGRLFRRIDDELQRRASEILSMMRPPPGPRPGPRPEEGPSLRPPPRSPDEQMGRPGPELNLPERSSPAEGFRPASHLQAAFESENPEAPYFVLWARSGVELARSTNAPADLARPVLPETPPVPPARTRGDLREVIHITPPGDIVLVGRPVRRELLDLQRVAWSLASVGSAVLLVGLAGGWWIAARAIRPVGEISAIAVKIAAGDLSQRVNVADTDSELGRLAGVLNSTFARLETAFDQQRQFAADAAHELRTPVSVILTQTETALTRDRSAAEYRETVEACRRAAQRMRRLIESLLELARLDAGQETLKRMRFNLSAVVNDCVALLRPLAEERGIRIQCELPPLECIGDPERLAQVITNLLTNAIQYNQSRGEVRITGRSQDGTVVLTTADTGPGIAKADLPHVFERFFRADKSRASDRAGLGLAICKSIVEAHGGTIEAASEPGGGTTFVVRLPAE